MNMSNSQLTSAVTLAVIFDGDDTLWVTERLYDEARSAARLLVEQAGLDGAHWETLQHQIDLTNANVMGHSVDRFPTSCVQAYERLSAQSGVPLRAEVVEAVRAAAGSVFSRDPELVPRCKEVLLALRENGVRLALLTKGDLAVQNRRIDRTNLRGFFDVIHIVPDKSATEIRALVTELGVPPESTWMVGNSVRSDVLPALAAGIRSIWIEAHVWEFEKTHDHLVDDRVITARELRDVPAILQGH